MAVDVYQEGSDWELSVAVPLKNPRLLYPSRILSEFSTSYTSGTSLSLSNAGGTLSNTTINSLDSSGDLVNVDYLGLYAQANDTVMFGPSNDTDDDGSSESSSISAISTANNYTFSIPSNLTYDYANADQIEITTEKFPAGWYFATQEDRVTSTNRVKGRLSNYGFEWTFENYSTAPSTFRQYISSNYLFPTTYRIGAWVRGSRTSTDADSFGILRAQNPTDGAFVSQGVQDSDLDSVSWIMITDTGDSTVNTGDFYVNILNGNGNDGTQTDVLGIDELFLEHAYIPSAGYTVGEAYAGGSGQTDAITANGYFAFVDPENTSNSVKPDLGSIQWDKRKNTQSLPLANETLRQYSLSGLGQRVDKYEVMAQFTNVPAGFYEVLREFERIQEDGNLLNFHPYMNNYPSTLTGIIELSNFSQDNWSNDLVSFQFRFREV